MQSIEKWKAWTFIGSLAVIALLIHGGVGGRFGSAATTPPPTTDPNTHAIRLTTDWSETIAVRPWQNFNWTIRGYAEEWQVRDADNPAMIYIRQSGQSLDSSKDPILRFQFRLSPGKRNDGNVFLVYTLK